MRSTEEASGPPLALRRSSHSDWKSWLHRDGANVHGDASGEWMLDEDGEVEDIVFFVSPGWMRRNDRKL